MLLCVRVFFDLTVTVVVVVVVADTVSALKSSSLCDVTVSNKSEVFLKPCTQHTKSDFLTEDDVWNERRNVLNKFE